MAYMDTFHSIGAFSRLTQISVKALRFYDSAGLLSPAKVDDQSGYRYYSESQLDLANTVVTLRATGVSIAEIQSVLAAEASSDLSGLLERQLKVLIGKRDALDQQIKLVQTLLASGYSPGPYRMVPTEPVLALQHTVQRTTSDSLAPIFDALERLAAESQARAPVAPFCELESDDDWRVCVPVSDSAGDDVDAEFVGSLGIACYMTYVGAYEKTQPALEAMLHWLTSVGISRIGPPREIYHRFGADQRGYQLPKHVLATRSDHYVTELRIPIELNSVNGEAAI
ncbi:MAG: MerR family transcriptional regulator [Pseudomonadota bacterium]